MMPYVSNKPNVLRDGYEDVAALIFERVRTRADRYCIWVDHEGTVRWRPRSQKHSRPLPDSDLIGTYDRHARIEHIEGDLIARMQELTAPGKRQAA